MLSDLPVPMLARLEAALPRGPGWLYEPKFDGFRGLLRRTDAGSVQLASRNLKDLANYFPELVEAGTCLPRGTVLDGEIVLTDGHGVPSFGELQRRLAGGPRWAAKAAAARAAMLIVFDLLESSGAPIVGIAFAARRQQLESLLADLHPCLQITVQTADADSALAWIADVPHVEGVVAKRGDGAYRPGHRGWVKVKRHATADCVVIGIAHSGAGPVLVLGLRHADGEFHLFGTSRPVPAHMCGPVDQLLRLAGPPEHPIRSRWKHQEIADWRRVPPHSCARCGFRMSTTAAGCDNPPLS